MFENDKKLLEAIKERESAKLVVEGYVAHFRAALLIGNKIGAEKHRQSAVDAFESLLDTEARLVKEAGI